jgi:hypothetical protein
MRLPGLRLSPRLRLRLRRMRWGLVGRRMLRIVGRLPLVLSQGLCQH